MAVVAYLAFRTRSGKGTVMPHLLQIQSSPRVEDSITRDLSGRYVARWRAEHPGGMVTVRDLGLDPIAHLGVDLLGGFFSPPESLTVAQVAAVKVSDELIAEVEAADILVIGVPMHNFSVPSTLKAWIDHVLRARRTFQYTAEGPKGLLAGKRAVVFISRGGVYSEGAAQAADFQEPYLRTVLGFIGITDVAFVRAEGIALGRDAAAEAVTTARAQIDHLAA
jgi:FMN-dependent NADH-azoreductase